MRHFLFIILILLVFFSCKKPQTYSEIPNLEYKNFELKDTIDLLDNKIKSGILTVSFTDGDGDIGLNPSDTLTPFDTSSIYYYNLYIDVYKMQNDTLVFQDLQVPLRYRIQDLTPLGQNKTLKGEIKVSINKTTLISDEKKMDKSPSDILYEQANTSLLFTLTAQAPQTADLHPDENVKLLSLSSFIS